MTSDTTDEATLARLDAADISEFQALVRRGQPVLITGAMAEWPALERWNHGYLRAATVRDDSPLPVFHAPGPGLQMRPLDVVLELPEIVDRLWNLHPAAPFPDGSIFYLKQQPLQNFAGLLRDVRRPAFYGSHIVEANLWMGGDGAWSPLHFDYADNLMCQVVGTRRVWLYAPQQGSALYPAFAYRPAGDEITPPHFSLVGDARSADSGRYPRFAGLQPTAAIDLVRGEMLYIPPYWWHHVEIVHGPAVQVNFWYSLQYGGPLVADDRNAEAAQLDALRVLFERASPARRRALGAVVRTLTELAGEPLEP